MPFIADRIDSCRADSRRADERGVPVGLAGVFAWAADRSRDKDATDTLRRQIAVERVPQHHSVQKRKQIHTKPDRQRSTHRKQRQDITGKIDRSDIVYKGEQPGSFPEGNFLLLKALCTDSRTHRKSAEKSGQDANRQASVVWKTAAKRRCQACRAVGKAGGKKETGQNHERKQSRNHFGEPECQTVGGERSGRAGKRSRNRHRIERVPKKKKRNNFLRIDSTKDFQSIVYLTVCGQQKN